MSAELNAVNNLIAGVRRTTGKGQAGIKKLARTAGKVSSDKKKKQEIEDRRKAKEEKRKSNESNKRPSTTKASTKKSTPATKNNATKGKTPGVGNVREALGTGKISIEEASKLNPKGTSTPISKKPSDTFTPKSKTKKATQPALPGMAKSKINQA
jgi:hypothetical protein